MSHVMPEPNSGCWLWDASVTWDGYGQFGYQIGRDKTKKIKAHRMAYEIFKGNPFEKQVLHKCDIRSCVNPDHLFLGTHLENMRDMARKGRRAKVGSKGSKHPGAILTEEIVREIRVSKERTYILAKQLGVSFDAIKAVRIGKTWKHVPWPEL